MRLLSKLVRGLGRFLLGAAALAGVVALALLALGCYLVVWPETRRQRGPLAGAIMLATALGEVAAALAVLRQAGAKARSAGTSSSSSSSSSDKNQLETRG